MGMCSAAHTIGVIAISLESVMFVVGLTGGTRDGRYQPCGIGTEGSRISIATIFLWALVQALKVESLQEKQAMSDFPQVWFHFARQALIGSLRIICMIRSSFIYFPNMAQDRERAFVCCCSRHRHRQR